MGDQTDQTSVVLVSGEEEPKQIAQQLAQHGRPRDELVDYYLELDASKQRNIKEMCDRVISWSKNAASDVRGNPVIYIGELDELIKAELDEIRITIESTSEATFVLSCDDPRNLTDSLCDMLSVERDPFVGGVDRR